MTSQHDLQVNSWSIFAHLADSYQSRPSYAIEALHLLDRSLAATNGSAVVADVGAGTGIFTRQIADIVTNAEDIIGVEPNAQMRKVAEQSICASHIRYISGSAEMLPFPDGSIDALTAANAAQRFDRQRFFIEASRVLKPDGIFLFVDNIPRSDGTEFQNEYLSMQERFVPEYRRGMNADGEGGYFSMDIVGDLNRQCLLSNLQSHSWPYSLRLDRKRFCAMAAASSVNLKACTRIGEEAFHTTIQTLFDDHADETGHVEMSFFTFAVLVHNTPPLSYPQ